jgi:phage shock protein PspC (stress-responsive transcriptional regulator)
MAKIKKRLYRNPENKLISGVCSGFADYFGINVVLMRIIWVALAFLHGVGIVAYLVAALIIPIKHETNEIEIEIEPQEREKRKLHRSDTNKILFGVCGGLAEYLHTDPNLIRIIFVGLTFLWGAGAIIYILCAIFFPKPQTA